MGNRGRTALLAAAVSLVVSGLLSVSVADAHDDGCILDVQDYAGRMSIGVSPVNADPGDLVYIVGTGYPPNTTVPLLFNGTAIGSPLVLADGTFEFSYQIPLNAQEPFAIDAVCGAFHIHETTTTTTTSTTLEVQNTIVVVGSENLSVARAGGILVFVGAGLVWLSVWRRRNDVVLQD